jgi:hypothetical protein
MQKKLSSTLTMGDAFLKPQVDPEPKGVALFWDAIH